MVPTVSRSGRGVEQLFHTIIGIYEGSDFMDKRGMVKPEVMNDLKSWHQQYVPDHAFGSHSEEGKSTNFYRHIHINHGPELERSIDAVKLAIGRNEQIRYSSRSSCSRTTAR